MSEPRAATAADLTRENYLKRALERRWNCTLERPAGNPESVVDYVALRRTAFGPQPMLAVELKCRQGMTLATYRRGQFIERRKAEALFWYATSLGVPGLLVYAFFHSAEPWPPAQVACVDVSLVLAHAEVGVHTRRKARANGVRLRSDDEQPHLLIPAGMWRPVRSLLAMQEL